MRSKLWLPLFSVALLLPALLGGATRASAQSTVQITGVGDNVVVNGVYVGHYTMAIPGTPSLDVFCIDFLNSVKIGDSWSAHTSNLSGSLENTRHLDSAAALYQQAAWLTTQFASQTKSEWGAIHAAIWVIMAPDPESITKLQAANWYRWETGSTLVEHWIAQAENSHINPAHFEVITDVQGVGSATGGKQEFITIVPEPGTLLLIGAGLLGLLAVARLRRRRDHEVQLAAGRAPA